MVGLAVVMSGLVWWVAGLSAARVGRRAVWRREGAWAAVLWLGTWAFSLCAYHRPGLTVGFDAFRLLAVTAGGTIPDRGLYAVQTEEGVKLGEVDEEFVFESRTGDRVLLGSFGWKLVSIAPDRVVVARAEAP